MNTILENKLPEVFALFEKNKVKNAYIFGSICTEHFSEHSDIDFLISFNEELEPLEKGENWWNLFYALQEIFHREIDLLTEDSLQNPYFIEVLNQTKIPIYGYFDSKIFVLQTLDGSLICEIK